MKPEVLALLVLVVVAVIGTYIVYSPKSGIPEGFDAASRAAALQCEKAYNDCLKAGSSVETCTKQSSVCLSSIINPSVSTVKNAPSSGSGTSTSAASTGTVGQTTPTPSSDYTSIASAALSGAPDTLSSDDSNGNANLATGQGLSKEWNSFLKQVQGNLGGSAVKPTTQQLDLVQGAGSTPSTPLDPTYTPSQTIIKPHEKVPKMLPTMTATVPTDANTRAQEIALNSIYTPSVRQMIRDDVKEVVREEVEANQINNPYEVSYQSY